MFVFNEQFYSYLCVYLYRLFSSTLSFTEYKFQVLHKSECIFTEIDVGKYEANCSTTILQLSKNSSIVDLTIYGDFDYIAGYPYLGELDNLLKLKIIAPLNSFNVEYCRNCKNLEEIYITTLVFEGNYRKFKYVTLPNISSVFTKNSQFNNLTRFEAPNITNLPDGSCFEGLNLESIILGPLQRIGSRNFRFSNIKKIVGISNVTSIGNYAFYLAIIPDLDLPYLVDAGEYAFGQCKIEKFVANSLIIIPAGFLRQSSIINFSAPNALSIEAESFRECQNLTNINIPIVENVTITNPFYTTGIFMNCISLKTISLPNLKYMFGGSFSNCVQLENVTLDGLEKIEGSIFSGCTSLVSLRLPNLINPKNDLNIGAMNLKYLFIGIKNPFNLDITNLKS